MKLTFPPIGARIVKSSIAVALCMTVYFIRTFLPVENGIPFYGALAALWCMQQYNDTTKINGKGVIFWHIFTRLLGSLAKTIIAVPGGITTVTTE